MDKYIIYCTPEQTKKALRLGAQLKPYTADGYVESGCAEIPTAEQMIGWLEEQGFYFYIFKDYCWNGEVQYGNNWYYSIDDVNSRKEATIAAIDAALEYLISNKKTINKMEISEKIQYVKKVFDQFLRDQNVYDAWYERYRLDNAMYNDEIPIESFISNMIDDGEHGINGMFYFGIQGTCMTSKEGDQFIAENKQCDILSNSAMIDADDKWMDNWKSLIDLKKLFPEST